MRYMSMSGADELRRKGFRLFTTGGCSTVNYGSALLNIFIEQGIRVITADQ
jgi:hypothetical protein